MADINKINILKIIVAVLLILVVTFSAFQPSLKNGFTNWDDNIYVTENSIIRHLSWGNTKWIFSSIFNANYHPLTILTYSVEYSIFNLNPFGYHLTNLALHLLNSLLVFWLIRLLTKNIYTALITGIFFGIHPLHVESVAWVSQTKDVLCAFFFLGATVSYIYYLRERPVSRRCYYLSLILFVLSLFSKAMAITLPAVLLLIDYLLYRKQDKAIFMDKIPFFALSLIFGSVACFGQYFYGGTRSEGAVSLLNKFAVVNYSVIFYLNKILLPIGLSCLYPYPEIKQHIPLYLHSSIAAFILLLAIVITRRYSRKIIFTSGLFLVTLVPVLQFIPVGRTIVADRYAYIPSIGIVFAIACVLFWLNAKIERNWLIRVFLGVLVIAIICALTFLTSKRCLVWKDSIALWDDLLSVQPDSFVAYTNRGQAYQDQGNIKQALADFNKAIEINPNLAEAYNNRGVIYYQDQGNIKQALADFNKAIEINPGFAKAYNNLAVVYFLKKEYSKSRENVRQAEKLGYRVHPYFIKLLKEASNQ